MKRIIVSLWLLGGCAFETTRPPQEDGGMAIVTGPQARQKVDIGLGSKLSGGAQIGPRLDPAQALSPIGGAGGNIPILWTAEKGVEVTSAPAVESWRSSNPLSYPPDYGRREGWPTDLLADHFGGHYPVLQTAAGTQPLLGEASPMEIGPGAVSYVETDPGEGTVMAWTFPVVEVLSNDFTAIPKDTVTGFVIARAVDMDGDANVMRISSAFTTEDLKIRSNAAGDAWILDSDGTGHVHTIGGSGSTPMNGEWQVIRFGYRQGDQHYLRVGTRAEVTASGSSGYFWGSDVEETVTISLFSDNTDDEVQIAAAFFCFGDDSNGEAAIERWLNHHYSSAMSN